MVKYFYPYAKPTLENHPPLKPSTPTGPSSGEINVDYEFSGVTTDPDADQICYQFDWGDETFSDWTSFVASGVPKSASHQWSNQGTFNVSVRAKDQHGAISPWSQAHVIEIGEPEENDPPLTPSTPTGPSEGETNTAYEFSGLTTDPDGDNIAYQFDWGDETFSDWTSFVATGEPNSASHQWTLAGTYNVRVRAKDVYGAFSNWSDPSSIEITESIAPATIPTIAWPTSFPWSLGFLEQFTNLGINALMIYDHWWDAGYKTDKDYVQAISDAFDRAEETGVKLYCYINNATDALSVKMNEEDEPEPFITKFKGKPACAGWFYADEPHCWSEFEGYTIPEDMRKYYPYLSTYTWPAGGHGQAKMLYDKIRGQDDDIANHPAFAVWDKGFMHLCGDPSEWTNTYALIFTPGGEILDVGSIDIYPNGNNWDWLDHWINYSCEFPNKDGFVELGKGMIAVIDAWTDGAADAPLEDGFCNLVNQCKRWEVKYPTLKGVGFYTPAHFLQTTDKGAKLRAQIKEVCRKYGWGG